MRVFKCYVQHSAGVFKRATHSTLASFFGQVPVVTPHNAWCFAQIAEYSVSNTI